jgi:predicted ATP-dependent serine protease
MSCFRSKPVSMQDIFSSSDIRKVLVEGEPGIGKTTMTHKLAYDWAQGTPGSGKKIVYSVK